MALDFTGYFLTDITGMDSTEQTQSGTGSWTISPGATASSITVSDGADPNQFTGDGNNDSPADPTQTYNGEFIFWETINTYTGSDGNTYTAVVFDYDFNGSGQITPFEESYFIAFIPNGFDPNNVTLDSLGNGTGGLPPGTVPPPGTTLTFQSREANSASLTILCLSSDSMIIVADGSRRIGDIQVGDSVRTRCGLQTVRWVGRRRIGAAEMRSNPKLRPVRIMAGALGDGLPKQDMLVSRQHRILVNSKVAERMFGRRNVLISAIKLTEMPGIFVDASVTEIEYNHLLFDDHEIIFADGVPTESLFTGPEALKAVSPDAREEILKILPEIVQLDYTPKAAAHIPPYKQQKQLVFRHLRNNKPLLPHAITFELGASGKR